MHSQHLHVLSSYCLQFLYLAYEKAFSGLYCHSKQEFDKLSPQLQNPMEVSVFNGKVCQIQIFKIDNCEPLVLNMLN